MDTYVKTYSRRYIKSKMVEKSTQPECFFLFIHAIFVGDVHKMKVTKRK